MQNFLTVNSLRALMIQRHLETTNSQKRKSKLDCDRIYSFRSCEGPSVEPIMDLVLMLLVCR